MTQKRLTKAQVVAEIAEMSELDKKSVNRVFESLTEIIKKQLGSRGPGEFVIPGLLEAQGAQDQGDSRWPALQPVHQADGEPAREAPAEEDWRARSQVPQGPDSVSGTTSNEAACTTLEVGTPFSFCPCRS